MSEPQDTIVSFAGFLEYFPAVELPVTLGEETHRIFSHDNAPLPWPAIAQHLEPLQAEPADEYTEYVPCFQLRDAGDFCTLVYWKAGLLSYQYWLVTFTVRGDLIDQRAIAGSLYAEGHLTQSVATITEGHLVFIVSGQEGEAGFDPTSSTTTRLQLTEKGKIVPI